MTHTYRFLMFSIKFLESTEPFWYGFLPHLQHKTGQLSSVRYLFLLGSCISSWLKYASSLWEGTGCHWLNPRRMYASEVVLPAVGMGWVKDGSKGKGGAPAGLASLLHLQGTWPWTNHTAVPYCTFTENEKRGRDNIIPAKQRWLIQWASTSPFQVKV